MRVLNVTVIRDEQQVFFFENKGKTISRSGSSVLNSKKREERTLFLLMLTNTIVTMINLTSYILKHLGSIVLFIISLVMLAVIPAGILFATSPFKLMNNIPTALLVIGTFFYTFINFLFDYYEYVSRLRKNYIGKDLMLNMCALWKVYKSLLAATIAMTVLIVAIIPLQKNILWLEFAVRPYTCACVIFIFSFVIIGKQTKNKN